MLGGLKGKGGGEESLQRGLDGGEVDADDLGVG